jgi:Leucine-rich repeat (LRR) protein
MSTPPIDQNLSAFEQNINIQELRNQIYLQTSQDNFSTLLNCRCVSRSWQMYCRMFLGNMLGLLKTPQAPQGRVNIPLQIQEIEKNVLSKPEDEKKIPVIDPFVNKFKAFQELADIFRNSGIEIPDKSMPVSIHAFQTLQDETIEVNDTTLRTVWQRLSLAIITHRMNSLSQSELSVLVTTEEGVRKLQKDMNEVSAKTPPQKADAQEIRKFLNDPINGDILKQITVLDLTNLKLQVVPPELNQLSGLQTLFLDNNDLLEVPDFNLPHLLQLCINSNKLRKIPDFTYLPNLRWLSLNENNMTKVPDFAHLPSLWDLDLSYNCLKEIPKFSHLLQLKNFIINHAKLEKIADFDFPELEKLDVGHNELIEVPNFSHLPQLQSSTLVLDGNPLLFIPDHIVERFEENSAIQSFISQLNYKGQAPLAQLYQAIMKDRPANEQKVIFESLDKMDRDRIIMAAWEKAGKPGPNALEWGKNHTFDDVHNLGHAVQKVILAKFEDLNHIQRDQILGKINNLATESQNEEEDFLKEHIVLLADVLSKL